MGCLLSKIKRHQRDDDLIETEIKLDWGSNIYSDEYIQNIYKSELNSKHRFC
jgi:hypothetical protein